MSEAIDLTHKLETRSINAFLEAFVQRHVAKISWDQIEELADAAWGSKGRQLLFGIYFEAKKTVLQAQQG